MSRVTVLDYGSGNVRSAVRALERVGAEVELSADPVAATEADGLVVPGVGAFAACMAGLRRVGAQQILAERIAGRPAGAGHLRGHAGAVRGRHRARRRDAGSGSAAGPGGAAGRPGDPAHGLEHGAPAGRSRCCSPAMAEGTRFYFVHSYAVHPGRPRDRPGGRAWPG